MSLLLLRSPFIQEPFTYCVIHTTLAIVSLHGYSIKWKDLSIHCLPFISVWELLSQSICNTHWACNPMCVSPWIILIMFDARHFWNSNHHHKMLFDAIRTYSIHILIFSLLPIPSGTNLHSIRLMTIASSHAAIPAICIVIFPMMLGFKFGSIKSWKIMDAPVIS